MTPLRPGKVVAERFEIIRVADSGGMGVVYQALDRSSDRHVALKVLMHSDQAPADRFATEVEHLSALAHPHIVGYVSHGITDHGAPYLVMPWLDGVDLEERLRDRPLSVDETLTLARRVADALAYLHGRGLVHRDLKPSNLFLPGGSVENVQVIDLGVTRLSIGSRALTLSGVLIGTPGFIAPEQARGDRDIAPAVDIFALGCVLFECLTGQRLFSGAHVMSVLAKILLEDAPRVREIRPDAPSSLDLLIHRMVAKDPEKRPRDGQELMDWLAQMDAGALDDSSPPSIHALTVSERRVVTVLVVILRRHSKDGMGQQDHTRADGDPLGAVANRFGLRAQLLADRTAIVLAPEGVAAADQASVLARFARHVTDTFPGATVALTTGSANVGSPLPAGEALDRAVTLVRQASPESGVLVDDVTAALITARFDLRREGERIIVEAERATLDPTRPLLGRPTSCLGRERELAILGATLAECTDEGGPKVVLVTAGAGVGKSRLRHELVRRLNGTNAPPMVLHCPGDVLHASTPYSMLAHGVRQAFEISIDDPSELAREKLGILLSSLLSQNDLARTSAFLGELLGARFDDAEHLALRAARSDSTAMTDQIGRAFEETFQALCRHKPVMMILEDLQWADAASMKLLDRALRNLEGSRLFVLALARPEVHERFAALFANRDATEIHLGPLPKRACAKLVSSVMGDLAGADLDKLVDRSEGNAFFLEELIRAADERARKPAGSFQGDDLPATVVALAQARLERLEPEARRVLRAASIFGDFFSLEGVAALLGESPRTIEPVVQSLIGREAFVEAEQHRQAGVREIAFRHALLRGTAYATLTEEDRALGHRLAASWLGRLKEDGEIVAFHWLHGSERSKAAESFSHAAETRWSLAHADAAARCGARSLLVDDLEAARGEVLAERIRFLASALGAARRLELREVVAGLEHYVPALDAGPGEASHQLLQGILKRAVGALRGLEGFTELPIVLANAACALGALSDFAGAKPLIDEAITRSSDDPVRSRAVRYAAARLASWRNDGPAALEILAEAVLPEDPRERCQMLLILAWAAVAAEGTKALPRGLEFISRAEELLGGAKPGENRAGLGDPVARMQCVKVRGACYHFTGQYELAAKAAEEGAAFALQAGLRFDEAALLHNAGEQYLMMGHREHAHALLARVQVLARDIGATRFQTQNEVLLDYLDGQSARLYQVAESARSAGDLWLELHARYWLCRHLAAAGLAEARSSLEQALTLARQLKVRTMIDDCTRMLADLDAPAS